MMSDTVAGSAGVSGFYVWLGLDVRADSIPAELKRIEQWVLWKAEPRKNGKGVDKVPYQDNGKKASSTDPATWTDFETARLALEEDGSDFSGAGFVVTNKNGIIVLDFDHVRDGQTGDIDPLVMGAVQYLGTYAEVSPSGTGIRMIGYGTLDSPISSRLLQGWIDGRFVTTTGHQLQGLPGGLSPIDPERLKAVRDWFTDKPTPQSDDAGRAQPVGVILDQAQCLEIRQALGYIDPDSTYDTWLQVGMALASTGAPNAFGLWNEWSATGEKYQAQEMRKKWASFRDKPNGVMLPSLFHIAALHGWVNPASRAAQDFEKATGVTYDEANRKQPAMRVEPVERLSKAPSRFPIQSLDALADWIASGASVEYRDATMQSVLTLASAAAARRYVTPHGDPLNLYAGVCGRTIGELRYTQRAVYRAFEDAGIRRMVRVSRFTSPAAVYRTLFRSPACLYLSDDYGGMSAFAKRQPSGAQEQALAAIANVYDGQTIQLDSPEEAGLSRNSGIEDEQPVIFSPSMSILALISQDHLPTLLRASELGRGALEQMLLSISPHDSGAPKDPTPTPTPDWVRSHLRALRGLAEHEDHAAQLDHASIFGGNASLIPNTITVGFPHALDDGYQALDALSTDYRVRPLIIAGRTIARRIMATLAAWADPESPVVTPAISDWAIEYVGARLSVIADLFDTLHGDGKLSVYDAVLARILDAKHEGLARGDLTRQCKPYRNLNSDKRAELVQQMLDDESVFDVDFPAQGRGRPKKRLIAAKYVIVKEV